MRIHLNANGVVYSGESFRELEASCLVYLDNPTNLSLLDLIVEKEWEVTVEHEDAEELSSIINNVANIKQRIKLIQEVEHESDQLSDNSNAEIEACYMLSKVCSPQHLTFEHETRHTQLGERYEFIECGEFVGRMREMAYDCWMTKDMALSPLVNHIDWEGWAKDCEQDYDEFIFKGIKYFVREM